MKILCVGDSLAMPRPNLSYEDTWIAKLKIAFNSFDFICLFNRAITTNVLSNGWEDEGIPGADSLEFYKPDICIIQLGIVDCAPRYVNSQSFFYKLINHFPNFIQKTYWFFIKKTRKRTMEFAEVPINKFKNNITQYLERCKLLKIRKVIFIKICMPDHKMVQRNPTIRQSVLIYNNFLEGLKECFLFVTLVDPLNSDNCNQEIFLDGYHPNAFGNDLVFRSIFEELKNE